MLKFFFSLSYDFRILISENFSNFGFEKFVSESNLFIVWKTFNEMDQSETPTQTGKNRNKQEWHF